jgi:hypothetical protein
VTANKSSLTRAAVLTDTAAAAAAEGQGIPAAPAAAPPVARCSQGVYSLVMSVPTVASCYRLSLQLADGTVKSTTLRAAK